MLIEFIKPDFSFSDDRGTLLQLVHNGWKQVNYITSSSGATRGGHYHKANNEAYYVISGSFTLTVESPDAKESETHEIKAGDFFIVPMGVKHSFLYTSATQLISFYDRGVEMPDGTKDIFTN